MAAEGSVSRWLGPLQGGDPVAVQRLWERYFPFLVGLARKKLHDAPRRAADEEDVALSAFDSFCRHAEQGRFPRLQDRDSLWQLLVVITSRKAAHQKRDQSRQKRGGEKRGGEKRGGEKRGGAGKPDPAKEAGLEQIFSREPSPEFAAQVAEECERLLRILDDANLQAVALGRMEGYTVEELAARLGYAPRSIKRKLQLIRGLWEKEIAP